MAESGRKTSVGDETSPAVNGNGEADDVGRVRHDEHGAAPAEVVTIYDAIERLWRGRFTVLTFVASFLVAGSIFLLGSRSEYRTGAVLMPEENQSQGIGNLGALTQFSGLLGNAIPTDLVRSSTQISPDLYPDIVQSTAIHLAVLDRQIVVPSTGDRMRLYDYLSEEKPFSLWEWLGRVPGRVLRSDGEDILLRSSPVDTSIIRLSLAQLEAVEDLEDRVSSEYDLRQGVVEVSVAMPDPEIAAQVASALVDELTSFVTSYRTERHRRKVEFIQQLHNEAQGRFNRSLDDLANFRDTHRNLARDLARTDEQRLQAEYDLAFNVYNSVASRLEEARIQLQEDSPVFKILQPITVPLRKSYPSVLMTLLLCGILGGMVGTGYCFLRPSLKRIGRIFRSVA